MAGPRAAISGLRLSGGLPALQDRLNQIRAQKGEANQASDVAPSDAVTLGRVLRRSDTARGELVNPRAPARDHLDQRRIASRGVVLLRQPRQHQPGLDTAPLERDRRRSSIVLPLRSSDAGDGDIPIQQRIRPHLDDDRLLVDHDLLDERSDDLRSFAGRATEYFSNAIAGALEMLNWSSKFAGLVSVSTRMLTTTPSIS